VKNSHATELVLFFAGWGIIDFARNRVFRGGFLAISIPILGDF
jgi:hypothetical protein